MKKVIMIYNQFLDREGVDFKIGGIETYLKNLSDVALNLNCEPVVIQFSNIEFKEIRNSITIIGVVSKKDKVNDLLNKAYEIGNYEDDILIFGSSNLNIKNKFKYSLAIQHGIYWDKNETKGKNRNKMITTFLKSLQIFLEIRRNRKVNTTICVDYNYINWYRALTKITNECLKCIPNFTDIPEDFDKEKNDKIKIVFARRFEKIRGSKLIIEPMKRILDEYENVEFTIAGSGSYEKILKEQFKNRNVIFTSYDSKDSIEFHKKFDISIVPSIASEGTSLSLLEAMAAKCCVVCTNIGGMTNIIIDNYNGIIIEPLEEELYNAIKQLIDNKNNLYSLSNNAFESVKYGFDKKIWKEKWRKILEEFINK